MSDETPPTRREYLQSIGLAEPHVTRGTFSSVQRDALAKAEKEGVAFRPRKPASRPRTVRGTSTQEVQVTLVLRVPVGTEVVSVKTPE